MWGDEQTALPSNLIISPYSLSEDLAMTKSRMFVLISALSASFLASPVVSAASDGVMMKDGKMMVMKDGKATEPMTQDVTMTDGKKVTSDGTITTTSRMKDGQMMTMDGKMKMTAKKDMKMEGMKKEGMKKEGMEMGKGLMGEKMPGMGK